MGCGITRDIRTINLYDLADINFKNNSIEIGNLIIGHELIKKIDIIDNDILLYVRIRDNETYLFVFHFNDYLFNNICAIMIN